MEEFEAREKQKMAQLEEEIRRAEQEKHEEIRGKLFLFKRWKGQNPLTQV
jgi:hypothetical protein